MSTIRKRIERGFALFTRTLYHHKLKTLGFVVLFAAALISNLPKIKMDTSTEGFIKEGSPSRVAYDAFREQFGRDEVIVVAINPPNVFDLKFLTKLKSFHEALEKETPHLDEVTSLISIRNTRGEGDSLIVEDLLKTLPETPEQMETLKARVLSHPLYRNLVISQDGTFTTLVVRGTAHSTPAGALDDALAGFGDTEAPKSAEPAVKPKFLSDEESREMVKAVRIVAARYNGADFPIYVAGTQVVNNDLKDSMLKNMRKFMLMAVLIISTLLFIMFRRVSAIFIPLLIVILSLLSTIGLMAACGVPIKMPTQILPSFLLAVGVGASVHILAIFYRRIALGDGKEEAIVYAVGHSGLAVVMTSLTTMAGLGSFSWAEIAPLADLGIFASAGVFLSLIYTLVMLPALLALIPIRETHTDKERERHATMDRVLEYFARISTSHPWKISITGVALFLVSVVIASTLHFGHNVLEWFPESWDIKRSTKLVDAKMRGASNLELVIDTGKVNGLYDPETLALLQATPAMIEKSMNHPALYIGKTLSMADMVKEINQALHANDSNFYTIPQDKALIAQELLLFENSGSDDLEDMVDSQFSKARLMVKVPWEDAYIYGGFLRVLDTNLKKMWDGKAQVTITGMIPMFSSTLSATIVSAAQSYLIAAVAITLMMILLIGDIKLGLVAMIPNLTPIVMALALIRILGLPLDMFTMLTGSIALGLAVDDTIHFMHNFRRYHHEENDVPEAVRQTLLGTGRAMLATTVVLSSGFFIFMFADMSNLINFGKITGFALIMALLADFLLAPALMALVHPKIVQDEDTDTDWRDENGLPAEVKAAE
ncbi:MAG: efflux RND transporter permease subunit [Nitrospinota bacterium]|nr:efflux RND transporter permease subunit [Nitrospinota bacterium]